MKFGWLCRSESYHIVKTYKDRYVALCNGYDDCFIDYKQRPIGFIYLTSDPRVTKDLSDNTLCKECKDHYPRETIVFELVKAKLCKV